MDQKTTDSDARVRAVRDLLPETQGIAPLEVQQGNAPQFKALIPPELYPLVREGSLRLFATRALPSPFKDLSPQRVANTGTAEPAQTCDLSHVKGQEVLPCELGSDGDDLDPARAYQMLRVNYEARLMPSVFTRSTDQIDLYAGNRLLRTVRAERARIIPDSLANGASAQLYRELVTVLTPASMKGYKFLTFRFRSEEEDLVWMYSPLLMKSRQLTATNRGEAMRGLGVALNDFDILSEHPNSLYPRTLERIEALMPVWIGLEKLPGTGGAGVVENRSAGCRALSGILPRSGEGDAPVRAAIMESAPERFTRHTHFVPRTLYRVHLNSKDPFLPVGRAIVYFDREFHMPLMKVTYGRTGKLRTLMVGAIGVASLSEDGTPKPYLQQLLVFDEERETQVLVSRESAEICDTLPKEFEMRMFDPSGLGEATPDVN